MSTPTIASPLEQTPERILRHLEWHVVRRLDGLLQGNYRSLFHGHGLDFAELREYQHGDDIRYIDWNVTARLDAPYIRSYLEERDVPAWFLADLSPSVDFGGKRQRTIELVAVLARLLNRLGNRTGAMFYDGRALRVTPLGSGRAHILRLINDLLSYPRPARAPFTDLTPLFATALAAFKRRSLAFVISDFISAPGWEQALSRLNQRHEVLVIRLWDPQEVELPELGLVVMEDAETGEQIVVDTSDRSLRRRFEEAARQREAALNVAFKRAAVDVLAISTTEDLVGALAGFAARRQYRRR